MKLPLPPNPNRITDANAHLVRYHAQCGRWGHVPVMLAWHPRQPLLATGSTLDHTQLRDATVWTPEGRLSARMPGTCGLVDLGWSWDGRWLATATDRIILWTEDAQQVRTIPGQLLGWNPASYHLTTYARQDGRWRIWDLVGGTIQRLDHPPTPIQWRTRLFWSPRGTYLAGCWRVPNGAVTLMVWERTGRSILNTALKRPQRGEVVGCLWHPRERHLLLWLHEEIIVVDLHGSVINVLPISSNFGGWNDSTPYQWSTDGAVLAASTESTVQLWTESGHPQTTLNLPGEALSVAWNPAGDVLATAAWHNQIQLWTRDGDHITDLIIQQPGLGGAAMQIPFLLAWDATGQYLAASLRGCTVHLWGL